MKDIIKNKISVENNITNENGIIQKANGMFWNMCVIYFMPKSYQKYLKAHGRGTQIQEYWNGGLVVRFNQII